MLHTYTMYYLHLISRDFAKKPVKSQLCDFQALFNAQCGNCCNLVSHIFGKNFVKVTFLLKKLHKQCGKTRHSLTQVIFSSNQLFSNLFSKTITFTNFFEKNVRENFCNFRTVKRVNLTKIS